MRIAKALTDRITNKFLKKLRALGISGMESKTASGSRIAVAS